MANKFCPNLNNPEAQALIQEIGLVGFYREYIKNGYEIPTIDPTKVYKTITHEFIKNTLLKTPRLNEDGRIEISTLIKRILKYTSKNSNLYDVLDRLKNIPFDVYVVDKFSENVDKEIYMYVNRSGVHVSLEQIDLAPTSFFVQAIVHEAIHLYTLDAYRSNRSFAKKMTNLYKRAKKLSNNKNLYGFKNPLEFMSEIYSNPRFQEEIKSLDESSLWREFLDFIRELLGYPAKDSIFNEAYLGITNTIDQIVSKYNQTGMISDLQLSEMDLLPTVIESIQDRLFINKDLFDANQQDSIRDSFIYQIHTIRNQNPEFTVGQVKDTLREYLELDSRDFSNSTDPDDRELGRNLNNVLNHFDRFWDLAQEKLKSFGVTQVVTTPIQEDNEDNIEDSAYESSDASYQRLNYSDDANFAQSSKDTASAHMKTLLSLIPRYEYEDGRIVVDEDGSYVEDRNLIGLPTFEDLDQIWNDLLYTLVDIPIGQKLEYLKNSDNPKHNVIYETIVSDPNVQYQNEFEVVFSKQQAKFITGIIRRPTYKQYYNKSTGKWETYIDPLTGFPVLEGRSISIIDTNRNQPENLIVADWYNKFLSSKLVKEDVNGNLYVDTENGKKLREIYNQALKDWNTELLSKVFRNVGIELSQKALESDGIYINRQLVSPEDLLKQNGKFIFDRLAGDLENEIETAEDPDTTLEANNPFLQETRPIDLLAKLENKVNPGVFESSFISGDNKAKYSFVNNTYATHQFRKLTTDRSYLNKLKTTDYASQSTWLNGLLNNPTFTRWFDFKYVDTLGNDANNQTNKPFRDMNTKEKEFFRIAAFQNSGQQVSKDKNSDFVAYFVGLTPSDKTTLPVFRAPVINTTSTLDTIETLYDQFVSEYNRVKRTREQNNDPNIIPIDNYHGKNGMGTKFIMFPMFNRLLVQDGVLLELDDTRINEIVKPALETFVQELTRDQINYWTSLGIYNKDIFDKSYKRKKGITDQNIEQGLESFAKEYAVNYFVALMNQTQLFSGDPALHGKPVERDGDFIEGSSLDKTWNNYFKRMAKDIAPGLDPNFEDTHFNTIFLKDLKYKSEHLSEYRKVIGHKVDNSGSYGDINPADAQEYTTLDEHLTVLRALGRAGNDIEEAVQRLKEGGNDINDIQLVLQPMKPVYVDGAIEDNINKLYYIKTSSFPLVPALTKGLEIDKLRQLMENNNIQRAVYESGVKLGLQGDILNISNNGGSTISDLSINDRQIITLPRTGFRIQQEIPFHGDDTMINEGSQGRKLILNNLTDGEIIEYNGKQITGREAKEIFEKLHIEKMNRAFSDLKEELGVDNYGRITNMEALANILKKEATDRNYPLNDIYSIEIVEDNGVKRLKVPLSFTQNAQRFESILNSLVTNRVIKSELPGFSKVQGAGVGFTKIVGSERLEEFSSEILWVNPEDTKLNYIREENGKLVAADILVPNYLRGVREAEIRQLESEIEKETLRIEELPSTATITRDNRYARIRNLERQIAEVQQKDDLVDISQYIKEDGTLDTDRIPESVLTLIGLRIPTQGYNSMMKFKVKGFLPRYMGDLAIVPAEITSQMGSDFDVDKLYIYNYHHYVDKNGNIKKIETTLPDTTEIDYSKLSKKQLDNLIIQMFEDRLSNPRLLADILEPNGFGKLPDVAKEVVKLIPSGKGKHILTSKTQNNIYNVNADGKMGTALFSLASTFYKAAQDAKLSLNTPLKFKNASGEVIELNNLFEINNIEGNKRSNVIMYLQSAAVDNAKEQILGNLNINSHTMNIASTMAMLGLPEDFIGYFMSQPVIREYVNIMQSSTDIIDNNDFDPALSNKAIFDLKDTYKGVDSNIISPLSINDLKNSLQKDVSPIIFGTTQFQVINMFEHLKAISDEIRVLQSIINPDTKGIGSSFAALESKYIQIAESEQSIISDKEGLLNSIGKSNLINGDTQIANSIKILKATRNMFSQINIYSGAVYGEIIEPLASGVDLSMSETNLRDIYNNLKSYILSSGQFIDSPDVNLIRDSLLYGKENIAQRWIDYSNTPEGRRNILTKRIKARIAKTPEDFNGLTANNTPASSSSADINNATMYFYDMINSSNPVEKKLAEDMVRYFIITGAQFGPNSIGKYITYDILEKYGFSDKLRRIEDQLQRGDIDILDSFTEQYFQNNPFKAKSVKLTEFPESLSISKLDTPLNQLGQAADYIVGYDTKTNNPVLYKWTELDADANSIYRKLPILGNKQLKKYDFDREVLYKVSKQFRDSDIPTVVEDNETVESRSDIISDKYNFSEGINSVLTRISEISQVPEYKDLARKLINSRGINNLTLTTSTNLNSNGSYNDSTKTVSINLDKISTFSNYNDKFEQVFLEELIHGLTVSKLTADNSELLPTEITAKNKINRLYNEYINNFVDKAQLERFRAIMNTPVESRTEEDIAFARAHLNDLYPLINVAEFVGQGLTKPEFREVLKGNNFWTRLIDLIKSLLGINIQSDLDFLYSNTLDLIQENQTTSIPNITSDTKINIYAGTNENADLSNFAIRPFTIGGDQFQSVEQYFQYQKWNYLKEDISKESFDKNSIIADKIMQTTNGALLKKLGRQFTDLDINYWNNNASNEMKIALKASFEQNPDALNKLLATGDATLTHTQDKGKWGTEFPKLLMEVRNELRNNVSGNIDEPNEFNIDEYNRLMFVDQRDRFFNNWNVKDYFNNPHKKYTAESQKRFLEANGRPGYDRLKIEFWNNELRVRRVDPVISPNDTYYNIDEESAPRSKEDRYLDRLFKKFDNTVSELRNRLRITSDEGERAKLILQIEATEARLQELKADRSIVQVIDSVERRLNKIEKIVQSESPNHYDINDSISYLKEFALINREIDFDTGTEIGKKYSDKADTIAGRAAKLLTTVREKAAELLQDYTNQAADWAITPNIVGILEEGVTEVGTLESGNLSGTQSSSQHIQAIQYLTEAAQSKANDKHSEAIAELLEIESEYHSKYKGDYSQFFALDENGKPSKYLISQYKEEFYEKVSESFNFWRNNVTLEITNENRQEFEEASKAIREIVSDQEYIAWLQQNDPDIYMKEFNSGKVFSHLRPAKRYITETPKDVWIDPRYNELMSKGENDPAVRLYNYIFPLFRRLNRKYNNQVNYVPELQKETVDYFMQGNIKGGMSNLWNNFVGDLQNDVYLPASQADIDPLTGQPRLRIPVRFFGDNLETIDRSTDLARIAEIVLFQEISNEVKHEVEPLLNIYYGLLKDAKQNKGYDKEGQPILIDKSADRLSEQAQYIINGWLYGLYRSPEVSEQKYGRYTDALVNYIRLKGMGYNPFSAIGNIMQGIMSNFTFAAGSQYFSQKDYFKATHTMLYSLAGNTDRAKKISKAFIFTDAFVRHNEMNYGMSRELKTARNKYSNLGNAFILQQMGEYFVQGQTMVAVLHNQKVTDLKGVSRPLWEAFDDNFNWKTEEFGDNPYSDQKTRDKLRARIRKAIEDVHGNYSRPIQNKKHFYWRLVYTFRTWLPQAITNRFGSEQTDILLGTTTKGRYRSLPSMWKNSEGKLDMGVLKDNILWLIKLGSQTTLSEVDKTNMRKNLSELIMLSLITSVILMMRAGFDDWDEEEKEVFTYLYNNLTRAQSDLLFFVNPGAMEAIIQDPIPAMSAARDLIDVTIASWDTIVGDPVYKSGIRKGQLKIVKETIDNIPIINQIPKNIGYMQTVFERR